MKSAINLNEVPQCGFIAYLENDIIRIFFSFTPQAPRENEESNNTYDCRNVDVSDRNYAGIVEAIISDIYPASKQYAILSNKALADDIQNELTPEKRAEYIEEYRVFQEYRTTAKALASDIISNLGL